MGKKELKKKKKNLATVLRRKLPVDFGLLESPILSLQSSLMRPPKTLQDSLPQTINIPSKQSLDFMSLASTPNQKYPQG